MIAFPAGRALRVVLHARNPKALLPLLDDAVEGADIHLSDSYSGLGDVLSAVRPDVVYSIAFDGRAGFPAAALLGPDGPGWIAVGGAGVDHLGQWDPETTVVTNSAGAASEMMAQYVLGALLHFALDVPGLQADQAQGAWNPSRKVRSLAGQTLVIVGLGHTGRAVAQLAKAVGMQVLGTRARPQATPNVDEVGDAEALPAFLARADAVAVCTPLIRETKGLIGQDALAAMRPGTILVDVSRGGVVDQDALGQALSDGHLGGAALDVFPSEPLAPDAPQWSWPNTLISPHCSAVYDGWVGNSIGVFTENIARWKAGKPLLNVVDPSRGY